MSSPSCHCERTVEEKVLCVSCTFACLHALLVACPCDLCLHLGVAFAVFLSLVLVVVLVLHTSKFRRFLFFVDACRIARAWFMQCRLVKRELDAFFAATCCFSVSLCSNCACMSKCVVTCRFSIVLR